MQSTLVKIAPMTVYIGDASTALDVMTETCGRPARRYETGLLADLAEQRRTPGTAPLNLDAER